MRLSSSVACASGLGRCGSSGQVLPGARRHGRQRSSASTSSCTRCGPHVRGPAHKTRSLRGTGVQQFAARRVARKRGRTAQRRTGAPRFADRRRAREQRRCRPAARWPSTASASPHLVESRLCGASARPRSCAKKSRRSTRQSRRSSPAVRCRRQRLPTRSTRCLATRSRRRAPRGARLHYYDAASPIVAADSLDHGAALREITLR